MRLVALRLTDPARFWSEVQRLWSQGDAVLPLDPRIPEPAVDAFLERMAPSLLVDDGETSEIPGGAPVPDGTAVVLLTSGSTGEPKGVVISERALAASVELTHDRLGARRGERWLCCLPPHHVAGFLTLVRSRALGSEPEIHPGFDPTHVAASAAEYVSLVPTMLLRLLDLGLNISHFKTILLGGAQVPPGLMERAAATGARVVRTYGMTETCGGVVYDGAPLKGVQTRTDDEGLVQIASPTLMTAYRNQPALTEVSLRDGWLTTTDVGEWNGESLQVFGRADDMIVTGGEKVAPQSVEARLAVHPVVQDVAVVGVPDSEWGSAVTAFVVLERGRSAPELEEWRAFVKAELPPYAAPRAVHIVDDIPRSASGKVDHHALRSFRQKTR